MAQVFQPGTLLVLKLAFLGALALVGTAAGAKALVLRFNDLADPAPVPRDTDYASVFECDVPIVVQHTRLDSRQPALALLTTVAYPVA